MSDDQDGYDDGFVLKMVWMVIKMFFFVFQMILTSHQISLSISLPRIQCFTWIRRCGVFRRGMIMGKLNSCQMKQVCRCFLTTIVNTTCIVCSRVYVMVWIFNTIAYQQMICMRISSPLVYVVYYSVPPALPRRPGYAVLNFIYIFIRQTAAYN